MVETGQGERGREVAAAASVQDGVEAARTVPPGAQGGTERSSGHPGAEGGTVRGRPGRRTVADRRQAVLDILTGKASIDQVAAKYGVLPNTVVGWRDEALAGIDQVLARGNARTPRERELELENRQLREIVSTLSVEKSLALKAIEEWKQHSRPSRPARWRK